MKYDQLEAKNRFEGLLGLFRRLHDKVREPINTWSELQALSLEGTLLCKAFDEELATYTRHCGQEQMYQPTIDLVLAIQGVASCAGIHIHMAGARLDGLLGSAPLEADKVWN